MSPALIALIVVVVIALIVVLWYIATRNGIIASRNRVDESWSGIDVQLKRRHDLVPNLVETVKGYATHEQQVFEAVTKARADAMSAQGVEASAQAEAGLNRSLADLRADFAGLLNEQLGEEAEVLLDEGPGHQGPARVTRYVGMRP